MRISDCGIELSYSVDLATRSRACLSFQTDSPLDQRLKRKTWVPSIKKFSVLSTEFEMGNKV
jgi:hypothetical protein